IDESAREVRDHAYTEIGPVLAADEAASLAARVERVTSAGWPAVFVLLDAAPWQILPRLDPWPSAAVGEGYGPLDAAWVWHVAPGAKSRGWRPHRDRVARSTQPDGTPDAVTVWIALTDATPDNGCIYVLPPPCDPYYATHPEMKTVHDVQN